MSRRNQIAMLFGVSALVAGGAYAAWPDENGCRFMSVTPEVDAAQARAIIKQSVEEIAHIARALRGKDMGAEEKGALVEELFTDTKKMCVYRFVENGPSILAAPQRKTPPISFQGKKYDI